MRLKVAAHREPDLPFVQRAVQSRCLNTPVVVVFLQPSAHGRGALQFLKSAGWDGWTQYDAIHRVYLALLARACGP